MRFKRSDEPRDSSVTVRRHREEPVERRSDATGQRRGATTRDGNENEAEEEDEDEDEEDEYYGSVINIKLDGRRS
jgi:hypothetical protein